MFKKMSLQELNYEDAARWVQSRCAQASHEEVLSALQALAHAAARADADCALEGLFPGSRLEVLLSRDLKQGLQHPPPLPIKVEHHAMQAIGKAIEREMESTNTKLMTLHAPGAEVVVYQPAMRDAVLLGTRTTLLSA